MPDIELSKHAKEMLKERNLLEEWVWRTIAAPDSRKKNTDDGNMHYGKSIEEREGRVLHVVVNQDVHPHRIVTVFFDRRFGKTK